MARLLRHIPRWTVPLILAALLFFALSLFLFGTVYRQNLRLTLDFTRDDPVAAGQMQLKTRGFYQPEANPNFQYRWTKPNFSLSYHYLPRSDYKLRLWLLGPSNTPAPRLLAVKAGGTELGRLSPPVEGLPQAFELTIPASLVNDNALNLQFAVAPYEIKSDPRQRLGVVVTRVELERPPGGMLLPPRALALNLALLDLIWLLALAGPSLAGVTPGRGRWWFWAALLAIIAGQNLWLVLTFAQQPFSLDPVLGGLINDLGRLAILEWALVICVLLSRFYLRRVSRSHRPEPVSTTQRHLPALTSLRFLAALIVLTYHLPVDPDVPFGLYIYMRNGFIGVSLFYVLSGFVLCYNYLPVFQDKLDGRRLKQFWWARFARVYPMYILTLLAAPLVRNSFDQLQPGLAAVHVLALQSFLPEKAQVIYAFNVPAWSVSVEFFFYLLFPFLIFWGIRHLNSLRAVALAGLVVWGLQIGWESLGLGWRVEIQEYLFYRFGPGRLCEFVLGLLAGRLFLLLRPQVPGKKELRLVSLLAAAGVLLVTYFMSWEKGAERVFFFGTLYAPAFAGLIFWLARYETRFSRWLSRPALVLLGEASYSFYLLHDLVIVGMTGRYTFVPPGIPGYLLFGAIIITTTLLSILAFEWYETPARLKLRKWLNPRSAGTVARQRVP